MVQGTEGMAEEAAGNNLGKLKVLIKNNLEHGREYEGKKLQHYRAAGRQLLEAKKLVGEHGKWEQWLHDNFEKHHRTAQKCMALAKTPPGADLTTAWDRITGKATKTAHHKNRKGKKPKFDPNMPPPKMYTYTLPVEPDRCAAFEDMLRRFVDGFGTGVEDFGAAILAALWYTAERTLPNDMKKARREKQGQQRQQAEEATVTEGQGHGH